MRLAGIVPNGRNFNFETLIYSHLDFPSESFEVVFYRLHALAIENTLERS